MAGYYLLTIRDVGLTLRIKADQSFVVRGGGPGCEADETDDGGNGS